MKTNALFAKSPLTRPFAHAALAAVFAFAGSGSVLAQSSSGMHDQMKSGGSDGSMKMHMAMQENQKKMGDMQMSGDTDHDFAMMMRAHHQAGIDMAKAEVESGKNPEMVKEAKKIIASQQKDIQKFDAWLQKHQNK
ncbi:DUF305 domain-containing protein [Massilia sp. GER05]|uniref:DUF305 domain-containing protein n=1 Tax=Massilia sp. GER05 TaxID=3394605 RepID=UPI003F82AA9E